MRRMTTPTGCTHKNEEAIEWAVMKVFGVGVALISSESVGTFTAADKALHGLQICSNHDYVETNAVSVLMLLVVLCTHSHASLMMPTKYSSLKGYPPSGRCRRRSFHLSSPPCPRPFHSGSRLAASTASDSHRRRGARRCPPCAPSRAASWTGQTPQSPWRRPGRAPTWSPPWCPC